MLALTGTGDSPSPASCSAVCDVYAVVVPNWKKNVVWRPLGFTVPVIVAAPSVTPEVVAPVTTSGGPNSYAPMSHAGPFGRPRPRWSVAGQALSPAASIAG